MSLFKDFCDALHDSRDTTANPYLHSLSPYVKDIESASTTDTTLADYCQQLTAIVQRNYFVVNGESVNEFAQVFGEAHFAALCRDRAVSLTRIREQKDIKTPDFLHSSGQQDLYFEVKTLSVVNGARGINNDLEKSLDANIDVERQLQQGKRVAIGVSEIQAYAEKTHRGGAISAVIDTLIEKTRQNIKLGQYSNRNTFLVLNCCLIPPAFSDNRTLRPAYCDDYLFPKAITGDLWMLAFARPGMLVHGCPEFEGKPCIEGNIQKLGILADNEYENVAGLLVVVYPLGAKPSIYGLYRSSNYSHWIDTNADLISILETLNGRAWNDEEDSNGWQLDGK